MYTDDVAYLYDLEHAAFDEDIAMYLAYAKLTGGPLLELGCGTGRVMLPLVSSGYRVVGIDSSDAMLQRAREVLQGQPEERWRLIHRDFSWENSVERSEFGMVYCALNTWSYLTDPEQAKGALSAAAVALRRGGTLLLDLDDPARKPSGNGELVLAGVFEVEGEIVTKTVAVVAHPEESTEDVTIIWDRVQGGVLSRTMSRSRTRSYTLPELRLLLEQCRFRFREAYGSWDLDPYEGRGDRLIVVAERQ